MLCELRRIRYRRSALSRGGHSGRYHWLPKAKPSALSAAGPISPGRDAGRSRMTAPKSVDAGAEDVKPCDARIDGDCSWSPHLRSVSEADSQHLVQKCRNDHVEADENALRAGNRPKFSVEVLRRPLAPDPDQSRRSSTVEANGKACGDQPGRRAAAPLLTKPPSPKRAAVRCLRQATPPRAESKTRHRQEKPCRSRHQP